MGSIPEPGQLVDVRRRQWIVSDLEASTIETDPSCRHLVRLASLDEDALGVEMEVIWEIEPGARIIEHAGLPSMTGIDDAGTLDAFLDAVRWGAATNADRGYLQSPFRSGVTIEDFQLDPLVRAIDMARTNLLIADDVGLGKTIEAGLVIQELLLRHRIRSVLVICPASLQEKWRLEMREKFGLDFHLVDGDYIGRLRRERGLHANPWTAQPYLITSIDWAKQGEGLRLLRDALPAHVTYPRKFDLLIIDEAHNVSPSVGRYAMESQRTRLIRTIAPHFQHKLFLTATPHDGYTESFTALLELLDDQRFARNVPPNEAQLARVMVRRLKSDLVDAEGNPLYPKRRLEALPIRHTEDERSLKTLLDEFINTRETGSGIGRFGDMFIHQLLRKRLSSSPAAFSSTLECHAATIAGKRSETVSQPRMDEKILRRTIAKAQDDYADDERREEDEREAVAEASRRTMPLTGEERRMLDELRRKATLASHRADSKAEAIIEWLETHLRPNGTWNDTRVILFTEYRSTQDWMQQILASHGFGGERLMILYGGMDPKKRELVKAAFQADPRISPVRILLATDAASEGIDLQNHCNLLIHLEIPYNPNVMEQRNGRIDRHGQKACEVVIWHPVDEAGGQGEDILRALRKLDSMRADMGSVNPVIAPQLPDLLEGRRKDLDTRLAEERAARARRFIKVDRGLRERVAKLHERLVATREEGHLSPEHVERAVRTALDLADKPNLVPTSLQGVPEGKAFRMPPLSGSWVRCLEGLEHPFTHEIRPITFDHSIAEGRDDVVLVHLGHPLVQMSLRLLRAEIWAGVDVKRMHRVTVRALPDSILPEPAVAVISRLVITGGSHHRIHEELLETGGYLREATFRRETRITEVRRWLDASTATSISDSTFAAMRTRYERHGIPLLAGVEARSQERMKSLENSIETMKRSETDDLRNILSELDRMLRAELAASTLPVQYELFSEDERTQLKRDRAAIEARLARIPDELEREIAAIESRFEGLVGRTFPIAVILLVPDSMVQGARA